MAYNTPGRWLETQFPVSPAGGSRQTHIIITEKVLSKTSKMITRRAAAI
jgi:hypothetical protein